MMGYGSSSSNLSPLAPPFTVDRSALAKPGAYPFVDLTEPSYPTSMVHSFQDWSNNPHNYFPLSSSFTIPHPDCDPLLPSSSELNYSGPLSSSFTVHGTSGGAYYGESSEVPPYYPSYVSPAVDDGVSMVVNSPGCELLSNSHVVTSMTSADNYAPKCFALQGKGLVDGPSAMGDGSIFPQDDYVNREFYPSKGLRKYEEVSYVAGVADSNKPIESGNEVHSDYKPVLNHSKFISTDLMATLSSSLESSLSKPMRHPQVPYVEEFNSRIPEMTYYTPHEQHPLSYETAFSDDFRLNDASQANFGIPIQNASRYGATKPCSDKDRKEISSHYPLNFWEFHPLMNTEGSKFDNTTPSFNMEETGSKAVNFLSTKNEKLPGRHGVFKEGFGIYSDANSVSHVPHVNLNEFSLNVNDHKVVGSTETYGKNADQLNPVVDSPCWRGAPDSRVSPFFEASDAVFTQNVAKVEDRNANSIQGHATLTQEANDDLKVTIQVPNDNPLHYANGVQEMLASSGKWCSGSNILSMDGTDSVVNPELLLQSNLSGVHNYDAFPKLDKESASSDNCVFDSSRETLKFGGHGHKEVSQASKKHLGHKAIDASAAHFQESMSQIVFPTVVNDLRNLSEALLFHCLDGTCELKEEDCAALNGVISNLNACVLKNVERLDLSKESLIFRNASASAVGSPSNHQKGVVEDKLFQEGKDNIVSGSEDAKLPNDIFATSSANMLFQENMTQAIKKILDENFPVSKELQPESLLYKNLWLEAEASLCSVNYMARYNRQKIEIEKLSTQRGAGDRSASKFSPPDPQETEIGTANEVMARYNTFKLRDLSTDSANYWNKGWLASSGASIDLNDADKLACGENDFRRTTLFTKDSQLPSATGHAAVDQASVIARFHMLNIRADESTNYLDMETKEQFSNSSNIPDLNKADQPASALEDVGKEPAKSDQRPPFGTSSPADGVEASVMARFQILKHRDDISSVTSKEECGLDDDDVFVGWRRNQPFDDNVAKDTFPDIKLDDYVNAPGHNKADHSTMEMKDAAAQGPPILNLHSSMIDDVEGSQMPRIRFLDTHDDNNSGFVVSRRNMSIEDGMTGVKMGPERQFLGGSSTGGEGILKEFYLFPKDDLVTGPRAVNQADQPNAGWSDGFYSDWEHVLKDEFPGPRY